VQVTIKNSGYLPTYVLSSAKSLPIDARVFVEVDAIGASIDSRDARIEIGHLEGWGRGLHTSSIFYQRSRGSVSERTVCFVVHGRGKVRIRAKGLRAGSVEREVEV
jgi:hypothetical protein